MSTSPSTEACLDEGGGSGRASAYPGLPSLRPMGATSSGQGCVGRGCRGLHVALWRFGDGKTPVIRRISVYAAPCASGGFGVFKRRGKQGAPQPGRGMSRNEVHAGRRSSERKHPTLLLGQCAYSLCLLEAYNGKLNTDNISPFYPDSQRRDMCALTAAAKHFRTRRRPRSDLWFLTALGRESPAR